MKPSATQDTRLSLRGVAKTWESADRKFTVRVPDLHLSAGEVALLRGESGTGKSTLLEMLGLVSAPDTMEVFRLYGPDGAADIATLYRAGDAGALAALRGRTIGFVVQTGALIPFLTVAQNVTLPSRIGGQPEPPIGWLLAALDLEKLSGAYPSALSIGQRQRTAIARALAGRPSIVLADEPTAALDPDNKGRVVSLLLSLAAEIRATVLIATHEAKLVQTSGLRRLRLQMEADGRADGHAVSSLGEEAGPCVA
ncbi:MAG: ATP-binding cassette domain-containing protein [Pseudomonadota bacterium]